MRSFAVLFASLFFALNAAADDVNIVSKQTAEQGSVTPEEIGKRLNDTAERTRKISAKGAARGAVVDFAWPQDEGEYKALNKYVVVLISAVSQDAKELPLRRVYVQPERGREIVLQKISSERQDVPKDSAIHAMLGPYREDSFYLAPASAMMNDGTLLVDFAINRKGFHLHELPGTPPDFIQADRHAIPPAGAKPDPKALKAIIEREYTGFKLPDGLQ
jgi:hypothetical protein